jgi:hypothetical protein
LKQLTVELGRAYTSIQENMNVRTIGIFAVNKAAIGGESWYLNTQKQQNLRQIYPFKATGSIPHFLNFSEISQFTKCTGSFTDGTNWYGAIYAGSTAVANQVSFYITENNIVIQSNGTAPTILNGTIVLEWISNV